MSRPRLTLCIAVAGAIAFASPGQASAATMTITPDVANTIRSDQPDNNFAPTPGVAGQMIVGELNVDRVFRGVLSFSLDNLPPIITDASLTITIENAGNSGGTPTFELFALTETPVVDEVTWNDYDAANAWAMAGGDFLVSPLASVAAVGPYSSGNSFTFDSPAFLAAIQAEAAGDGVLDLIVRAPNFEAGSTNNIFRFSNGAFGNSHTGPELSITGVPEPSTVALMSVVAGLGLVRRAKR